MKQIKKERGIPLYLVEFFDYDYDQNILTIQMQSGNKRDFPYVTKEIYNQFKDAMANDASLFTLYTEHTNFSDVKPLEVKDIPIVENNNMKEDYVIGDYVIVRSDKDNIIFAVKCDDILACTFDENEATHFNSFKKALDLISSLNDPDMGWKVISARDISKLKEK